MALTLLNLAEATQAERKRSRRRQSPRARKAKAPAAPGFTGRRMYSAAKSSRLTEGWGTSNTSADGEISSSLRLLRSRSRALVRDYAHAKRAKQIVQNNVVGGGIGLQAQVMTSRDQLNERINDDIETALAHWSRASNCHTGGKLSLADFERACMGEIFEAGEVFVRKHYSRFGDSRVPLGLELIEAERVVDEFIPSSFAPGFGQNAGAIRLGVEVDDFYRPVAYWIRQRHPGEIRLSSFETDHVERVPADQIVHLGIVERWPQTRSVPWLHAVARKLNDMDGYSEAEIIAARAASCYVSTIETAGEIGQEVDPQTKERELVLEPGMVERLAPGEKFNLQAPNRPNAAMETFMRLMLREVAAGSGCSYESLSRDYSQSNYSSSRLALLDDRDLWRMLQLWFIRSFREELHRTWLQQAVLARAVSTISVEQYAATPERFEAVCFKPRGWGWVDPTKEVSAYKEAIKAGLTTSTQVIAQTGEGRDIYDVLSERERELRLAKEKGLVFDTDPSQLKASQAAAPAADNTAGDESALDPANQNSNENNVGRTALVN